MLITAKKQLKGLTLVELLVVLGIIITLSAVALAIINPIKQRNRARDGVLQNAIASIGQSVDSFYGLKGYYPNDTAAQRALLLPYIQNFTVDSAATNLTFSSSSIFVGGVASGPIYYYVNDFNTSTPDLELPCIEAASNENPLQFIAWAPGFATKTITSTCHLAPGYTELTGITPN
jgi:type II secretory pathway pseudopilin PulG